MIAVMIAVMDGCCDEGGDNCGINNCGGDDYSGAAIIAGMGDPI